MNLEDLIDEKGLLQNEWSTKKLKFGKDEQLTVIGWSGQRKGDKYYIVKCSQCSLDTELYGDGVFRTLKRSLDKGQVPCGCAKNPHRTEYQYKVLCHRMADRLGLKFYGWWDGYRGIDSSPKLYCEKHSLYTKGKASGFLNAGKGCRVCGDELGKVKRTEEEGYFISRFEKSSLTSDGTKFKFLYTEEGGSTRFWEVLCGDCSETYLASTGSIDAGKRSCACNSQARQREAYIHIVKSHGFVVAIKFGIARDSGVRLATQSRRSALDIVSHGVWVFESNRACRAAERACKTRLNRPVLSRQEMPDGWTETTCFLNLGAVESIYKEFGGILKCQDQ